MVFSDFAKPKMWIERAFCQLNTSSVVAHIQCVRWTAEGREAERERVCANAMSEWRMLAKMRST